MAQLKGMSWQKDNLWVDTVDKCDMSIQLTKSPLLRVVSVGWALPTKNILQLQTKWWALPHPTAAQPLSEQLLRRKLGIFQMESLLIVFYIISENIFPRDNPFDYHLLVR